MLILTETLFLKDLYFYNWCFSVMQWEMGIEYLHTSLEYRGSLVWWWCIIYPPLSLRKNVISINCCSEILLIPNCPIFLLILVNWGDFFLVGDIQFMAVMLKGPRIWNKRWNIQICVQKLAKEGQNFYVQAINYQLPLDFQFSDIENT